MFRESNRKHLLRPGFSNVLRLGYVSLFTDISTEMILGVLPFFVVKELGGTAAILGFIEGVAEAVNHAFRVAAGVVTDKIGRRKPLVLLGYGLSSFSKPLFAVAGSWSHAFAVRVADRAGKGIRTSPRDALISDSVDRSKSGKAFGLHRSLDQLGAIAGPVIAFAVIPLVGIRGVFWLSFLPAVVALFILLFLVRDTSAAAMRRGIFESAREVMSRKFIFILVILGVFSLGAYNFSFILLRAGALGVPEAHIPLVYASLNAAVVVVGLPAGILADRVGKIPVLGLAYMLFAATSAAGLCLTGDALYAFAIAVLFGCYLGIAETVQRAVIPDFASPELKGTAYAIYYTLVGSGSLVANSMFGVLWSIFSPAAAFQYSILTSAASIVALMMFITRREAESGHGGST
ncbi:MFS transporter [Candidatus Bathyarchaeota archaeon]|nr:MFS transporter [Candidatus Bathyarchaeota archaeon]